MTKQTKKSFSPMQELFLVGEFFLDLIFLAFHLCFRCQEAKTSQMMFQIDLLNGLFWSCTHKHGLITVEFLSSHNQ